MDLDGEPRDSEVVDVDSSRSEDEEPDSEDLEAIDNDSDIEEIVDHAGSLAPLEDDNWSAQVVFGFPG